MKNLFIWLVNAVEPRRPEPCPLWAWKAILVALLIFQSGIVLVLIPLDQPHPVSDFGLWVVKAGGIILAVSIVVAAAIMATRKEKQKV